MLLVPNFVNYFIRSALKLQSKHENRHIEYVSVFECVFN